ncbi:MAG: hypothetical protein ACI89L_000184 [Phycisphaerales bacterium]|jgi:hypothetical protein
MIDTQGGPGPPNQGTFSMSTQARHLSRWTRGAILAGFALGAAVNLGGCIVGSMIGGMAESYQRSGTTKFQADYPDLAGHSYAVVVHADRAIQGAEPGLVSRLTSRINDRIARNLMGTPGTAFIPSDRLLSVLYNNPQWPALPPSELGKMLGVERLVWIDLAEYRLNEPGNQYLWEGVAAGAVSVYDVNAPLADDPVFDRMIQVGFPDSSGFMRTEIAEAAVTSELSKRFVNRAAWLFYEHEEPNSIAY